MLSHSRTSTPALRRLARSLVPLNVEKESREMQPRRAIASDAAQYVSADGGGVRINIRVHVLVEVNAEFCINRPDVRADGR